MTSLLEAIVDAGNNAGTDVRFPRAPVGWTRDAALRIAQQDGLIPGDDHWRTVRALQEYYARHEATTINARGLHDALDELFHDKGGLKFLYRIFPGGPVTQGCRLAGLKAPTIASDKGFGSVM